MSLSDLLVWHLSNSPAQKKNIVRDFDRKFFSLNEYFSLLKTRMYFFLFRVGLLCCWRVHMPRLRMDSGLKFKLSSRSIFLRCLG